MLEPEQDMNTTFFLMAQYKARAVIPIAEVVPDYFSHLTVDSFIRKVAVGDINIPVVRIEGKTQKSAKGVHINDLAAYIDKRREAATKEAKQLAAAA